MTTGNVEPQAPVYRAPDAPARAARILFYYSHLHLHTGSPRALLSVMDGLDRARFTPMFLAIGDGPLPDAIRERNIDVISGPLLAMSPRYPIASIAGLFRQLRLLDSLGIDLVHIHEVGWNYDLVVAAAIRRIPVVLHLHNPAIVHRNNLHWRIAGKAVFVSRAHLESATNIDRARDKATVIYNAVELDRFTSGTSLRASLGIRDDQYVVGCVAQIAKRKGVDLVVEAAARLIPKYPDVVFLVVGPNPPLGTQEWSDALRARAEEPVFDGRLRFIGERADIPNVLATCDAFCMPSRAEPLGIAIIEAMAAGLPVVASRVGGIPEIVNSDDIGLLVDAPPTADAVTAALDRILSSPDRGRALGRRGADSLRGRFDATSVAARWNELYSGLLRAAGRLPR